MVADQREIARRAKTSLKTVSRVVNKDPLVNAETRARIEQIIAEIGYEPHLAARMMRSRRSDVVGFIADGVATTSSSVDLVRGAQDVAWESGKQMMLFNIERGTKSQALADAQLAAFRAEAIIYATVYHQELRFEPNDVPHVLLNCFEAKTRFPTVLPDDYQLGRDLTEEALARGYRRPLFLNLAPSVVASGLRARGFLDAAAAHGLDLSHAVHVASEGPEHGDRFVTDQILPSLFDRADPPDLVICGQDMMAMNVYFLLAKMGRAVGRDVAVASFDNLQPIARLLEPGLSTMELPYYEMGRAAMRAAISGGKAEVELVRGRFISRESM